MSLHSYRSSNVYCCNWVSLHQQQLKWACRFLYQPSISLQYCPNVHFSIYFALSTLKTKSHCQDFRATESYCISQTSRISILSLPLKSYRHSFYKTLWMRTARYKCFVLFPFSVKRKCCRSYLHRGGACRTERD